MKTTVIENRFKCPKKLWNKFSDKGKIAYNNVRSVNPDIIHPKSKDLMGDASWDTVSHNYACFAAWEF